MARILTGIQPSGALHIGNYFGAMKPIIDYMKDESNEIFIMVADYHALTSIHDAKILNENINNVILDYLACGLDPEKINFYVQSDVPQVQELAWLLHTVCPMGLLNRATSYRDKVEKGIDANSALFTYPVLQAADILIFNADIVPVGKDQKQHIEIARDLAIKFNNEFGETFQVPVAKISKEVAIIPGQDGQKMSKSYGNTIPLFADEKVLKKKVMSIVTDSKGVEEVKDPKTCTVFSLYCLVSTKEDIKKLEKMYLNGGLGYGDAKKMLLESIVQYFKPFYEKRNQLKKDVNSIQKVRDIGRKKVSALAQRTLEIAKKKVGLL